MDDTHYLAGNLAGLAQVKLTPNLSDPRAKAEVDGVEVNDEGWIKIDLAVGDNEFTIKVTAADGTTTKLYNLKIPRVIDTVATLRSLTLSDGAVPVQDPSDLSMYSADVHYSVNRITVTPTARSGLATVTVNGTAVDSGSPSAAIELGVGPNEIQIQVTAEDKSNITYTLTVTRAEITMHTVTFDTNGGSAVSSLTGVTWGSPISAPEAPAKSGYKFAGWVWYNDEGYVAPWNFAADRVMRDITLSAQWTKTYTVTFNSEGGSPVASIPDAIQGNKINAPAEPTRSGYSFSHWYLNPSNIFDAWDFNSNTVTSDIALHAYWTANDDNNLDNFFIYRPDGSLGTLIFNSGTTSYHYESNGDKTIKVNPIVFDERKIITVNRVVVESGSKTEVNIEPGYHEITITVTAINGTTKTYAFGYTGTLSDDNRMQELTLSDGTVPVRTGWEYAANVPNDVRSIKVRPKTAHPNATVTVNGVAVASGSESQEIALKVGLNTIPMVVTAENGTTKADFTLTVTRAASGTTYTIAFDSQGGSAVESLTDVDEETTIGEPEAPTKSGYNFAGWYKEETYATPWSFDTDTVTANATLYAKWTEIPATYTITFDTQGGSEIPSETELFSGSTISEPVPPTKDGFLFAGWYKEPTYVTYWIFRTDRVTADTTIYAKWAPVPATYTVFFLTSGGSAVPKITGVTKGSLISEPEAPTREGYLFGGWYDGEGYTTPWNFGTDKVTENTYLFAKWIANSGSASDNALLERLTITGVSLSFEPEVFAYQASVANGLSSVKVTPRAAESHATIKVNGTVVTSGSESGSLNLKAGGNLIQIEVLAQDGKTVRTYSLTIVRAAAIEAESDTPIPVTPDKAVTVTVPLGVTNAHVSVTPIKVGDSKEATLPLVEVQAATSLGNVSVTIPEGTKITAPSGWDGTIKLPEVQRTDSVSIPSAGVNAVIKVGSDDVTLSFDRAVRLLIPGQGGKSVGFVQGGLFKAIADTISADTQEAADREIAAGGEAALTVGRDLVIWTKHFTQFAAYTPITSDPGSPVGSGSGAAVDSVTIQAASGGTATLKGVHINVPAGASAADIRIMVELVGDISVLPQDSRLQLVGNVYEVKKDSAGDFAKPVVITLPFDKSKVDPVKSTVAVYGLDASTHTWVQLDNPSINEQNGTVSGTVTKLTTFAVLASDRVQEEEPSTDEASLTDLKGHWSEANVRALVKLGAINGYPDNTFRPNANMTRAEFVTAVVKAFKLDAQAGVSFDDTDSHWAKDAIATAVGAGIVDGYSDGRFSPDDLITREQMALIVVRAAKLAEETDSGVSFTDNADISVWARAALATATARGLINGYADGSVKPGMHGTRAEAAAVIRRALSQ
ncbi:InlB B-repeat-containing protein [Cohnella sp. OV330]|uniref:InlB B-repeat-containing protein n=1 Tax=Cohnella sp. OV330 TaxID=1855288 RepID=UPI001313DCFC|nr:InlB B-repeat-containing protein [Cohnella sp. OV330]